MDIWIVTRTVLEKNPGIRAKSLLEKVEKKTKRSRSTIYEHLNSFELKREIHREKGRYYLPHQWNERIKSQNLKRYSRPNVEYEITQRIFNHPDVRRQLPNVGFHLVNLSDYPIRVRIEVRMILGGRNLGLVPDIKGHYNGKAEMGFEPGRGYANGSFSILEECAKSDQELTLEVRVTAIDPENEEHRLFPKSWTYIRGQNDWYYEPKAFTEG